MSEHQPLADNVSVGEKHLEELADNPSQLSLERRTLLFGAAAVAAGALSARRPLRLEAPDLSAALAKFRATIPSHFDREYVENAVVPFFLGSIFRRRASDPADDRPAAHETGRDPLGLLGDALRRLEADPFRRRDRFSRGAREPRRQQSAQAHLFHRRQPRSLRSEIPGQGRRLFRQASRSEACRQAVHAPLPRLLLGYLLGPASRREGRRGAASSPHDRGEPSTQCSPTAIRCRRSSTKTI